MEARVDMKYRPGEPVAGYVPVVSTKLEIDSDRMKVSIFRMIKLLAYLVHKLCR